MFKKDLIGLELLGNRKKMGVSTVTLIITQSQFSEVRGQRTMAPGAPAESLFCIGCLFFIGLANFFRVSYLGRQGFFNFKVQGKKTLLS